MDLVAEFILLTVQCEAIDGQTGRRFILRNREFRGSRQMHEYRKLSCDKTRLAAAGYRQSFSPVGRYTATGDCIHLSGTYSSDPGGALSLLMRNFVGSARNLGIGNGHVQSQ